MITYGSEVVIRRPPDEVWPYLMERDKQAQWSDVPMAEAKLDDQTGESPLRAGMTIDDLDAASGEVHDATLAGW